LPLQWLLAGRRRSACGPRRCVSDPGAKRGRRALSREFAAETLSVEFKGKALMLFGMLSNKVRHARRARLTGRGDPIATAEKHFVNGIR